VEKDGVATSVSPDFNKRSGQLCLSSDYGLKDWFDLNRSGNFISPITSFRPNSGSNQPWVQWL